MTKQKTKTKSYPKVLIGTVTADFHQYCLEEFLKGVKKINYPNFNFLIVDNSKTEDYFSLLRQKGILVVRDRYYDDPRKRIAESRNVLREKVLNEGYDYFLSLDQDVIPPPDVIQKLIKHEKGIVNGLYYSYLPVKYGSEKKVELRPCLFKIAERTPEEIKNRVLNFTPLTCEEVATPKLIEVFFAGTGCMMIHRDVLEKTPPFHPGASKYFFDDICFCIDAMNAGYKVYADTSVRCEHLIENKPWYWKRGEVVWK